MYKLSDENLRILFDDLYKNLDVPPEKICEAKAKYEHLGEWLNLDAATHFRTDSILYLQGSALLGTGTRPIKQADEYDFDLVYRRNIQKDSISQAELKDQVGQQLRRYIKHLKDSGEADIPMLEAGERCWTLRYSGRFHMDILPAIPDPEPEYAANPEDGIIITDKNLILWQFSNPKGFHTWFRSKMLRILNENRAALAKAANVSVETIPEEQVKTTLQKSVQILKRHRDSIYNGDPKNKPASIIITTLAGLAYDNSRDIYQAIQRILSEMPRFIENRDGVLWVQNPVNAKENFADRWKTHPARAEEFFKWMESARQTFSSFTVNNTGAIEETLFKSFGIENAGDIARAANKRAGLAAAANAVTVKTDPWSR